jgi:transposase
LHLGAFAVGGDLSDECCTRLVKKCRLRIYPKTDLSSIVTFGYVILGFSTEGGSRMARKRSRKRKPESLGVIWEVPDTLWERIEPILEEFWPRKATGRSHADWRKVVNGIIFRIRTGCQWDQLPKRFGPKSTVHDWFQRWNKHGVWASVMAVLIEECDELGGVDWKWQAADGAMAKAPFGGTKSARIRRIEPKTARNAA